MTLRTAWRDARRERGLLLMFMSAIILGISALVAINAFNDALVNDIDKQASTLLGADLEFSSNKPIKDEALAVIDSVVAERSEVRELLSMAYFPEVDKSQFVRIRALQGGFPYYGEIKVEPRSSVRTLQSQIEALVDRDLLSELGLSIGNKIKLGETTFTISGALAQAFGGASISGSFAPIIYIGLPYLEGTQLVQPGSLVDYDQYFLIKEGVDIDGLIRNNKEDLRALGVRTETIASQKEDLSEAFDSLNNFLNLVALVALLLGCIGVASSVFVYVKRKFKSIAILRCLGMSGAQAMQVYLVQILVLGIISILIGIGLGSLVQKFLPIILVDFLPFDVQLQFSWMAVIEGFIIGVLLTSLFALWPLLEIKKVSPLRVLRSVGNSTSTWSRQTMLVIAAIILAIWMVLWYLTKDVLMATYLTLGLTISFLFLYMLANVLGRVLKKYLPSQLDFVWKQGISNLYRPNNQTSTLLISIGLGTGVLATLFIVQSLLLNNIQKMDAGNQPNMILFGIETNQKDSLAEITRGFDMPVIQEVPIVTMRLEGWQGRSKSDWLEDTTRKAENWVVHREARVTYRDTLDENEELLQGKMGMPVRGMSDTVFVSLAERYANALNVGLGDELIFNVQGTRLQTFVGSIRKMEFASMQARFFIVFPSGVLEEAPQFHVLVTKSPDGTTMANYRTEVVKAFPNVSVVDLASILQTVNEIFKKISYVIQFMAGFSILTGLLVLISSLWLSKFQRIRENALLRTLGASSRQLLSINLIEYAFIGILASFSGILLAVGASYLITIFRLDLDYDISWTSLALVALIITSMTVIIGMWNTRDVLKTSPKTVLQ